ncbi:DUF1365 domain-containing protein [Alphaproteobacteria bacterium]|nr:DUF1365 domain-containing protein [Alphaproteobacteria bacterium]
MITPGSQLYFGEVRHARYRPRLHRFRYRVFSMLLDLDEIEREARSLRLFSVNRFNLFSFFYADHGYEDLRSPRSFIEDVMRRYERPKPDRIHLLCYPRILGYVFNPLSVYFVMVNDVVDAIIYEVRNTFGEKHIYFEKVCGHNGPIYAHQHEKAFHVSPFIDMNALYHFSTGIWQDNVRLVIRETEDNQPLLLTSFVGKRHAFSARELRLAFLSYPLMTAKIIFSIHYQAFRLMLKGVRFHRHPNKRKKN